MKMDMTNMNQSQVFFPFPEPLEFNYQEVDGMFYMLDRDISGCLTLFCMRPMNDAVTGTVTLDGVPINGCMIKSLAVMQGVYMFCIPLLGRVTEHGRDYKLHIEGLQDIEGNILPEQDYTIRGKSKIMPLPENAAREAVALQAAQEGIVLLKNDNDTLPLPMNATLNLFGKDIYRFRTGAVGAGKINPRYTVDFLEAVQNDDTVSLNRELVEFYGNCNDNRIPDEKILNRAKGSSDTAIVFISRAAGENFDSAPLPGEYYLTEEEETLLGGLREHFGRLIVLLNTGYPIDTAFVQRYQVDAVVYFGFGGMLAGQALLNVLTGKVSPSGKLPDTWAASYEDIPASANFYDSVNKPRMDADSGVYVDTVYEEDIYVGYRYFTTFGKEPAFPFGFGLSYTTFTVLLGKVEYDGTNLELDVMVCNTGKRSGAEVVQVYVGQPDGTIEKPDRILVDFEKTKELAPGETQKLHFTVTNDRLSSYFEAEAAYKLESGIYRVFVGTDVNAPETGSFAVDHTQIVKQVKNRMTPVKSFNRLSKLDPIGTWPKGLDSGAKADVSSFLPEGRRERIQPQFAGTAPTDKIIFSQVCNNPDLAADFVAQLSIEEIARLSVCASAGWGMEGTGEAGRIFKIEGYDLPDFPVSDGNSGINLNESNIGMPSGATLCASFNKELMEQVGEVIGLEAKSLGMSMILAPALNLHRHPLNGRQPEYFSEDPLLAGLMAGHYAKGLESTGVGSCMKHLIANNCETSRKRNQSIISERAIRELYFRAFEIAMQVHMPASVMTAYNAVNGVPTAADEDLIQGLLREENGFDGFVMTDWNSYDTADPAMAVAAGNSWLTPGSTDNKYTDPIVEGINNGTIPVARLQENVFWMIRSLARLHANKEG